MLKTLIQNILHLKNKAITFGGLVGYMFNKMLPFKATFLIYYYGRRFNY